MRVRIIFIMSGIAISLAIVGTKIGSAQNASQWIGANGKSCNDVCPLTKLNAVELGKVSANEESYVCAGTIPGEPGRRGGFQTFVNKKFSCAIGTGSGLKRTTNFACLCTVEKTPRP